MADVVCISTYLQTHIYTLNYIIIMLLVCFLKPPTNIYCTCGYCVRQTIFIYKKINYFILFMSEGCDVRHQYCWRYWHNCYYYVCKEGLINYTHHHHFVNFTYRLCYIVIQNEKAIYKQISSSVNKYLETCEHLNLLLWVFWCR